MVALYRSGRAADALETYQSARRVHVEELGLEPGPELRRMQEAILAHDPGIAGAAVAAARRAGPDERSDELAHVVDQLRENLRNAEELYERARSALEGRAVPARPTPAFAALSG
jgi:DNA-binding SARP family transcriptional activator